MIGDIEELSPLLIRRCLSKGIQREIFLGSLNFWAMFGAVLSQSVSDRFGRRMTFVVAALGFIAGILVMIVSNSFEALLFGRMLVGFGVGIGLAIDPLYISEMSPAKHRGELVTWSEIALNVRPTLLQPAVSCPSSLLDSLFLSLLPGRHCLWILYGPLLVRR